MMILSGLDILIIRFLYRKLVQKTKLVYDQVSEQKLENQLAK